MGDVTSPGVDDAGVAVDAGLDGEAGLLEVSSLVTGAGVVTAGLVAAAALAGATAAPLVDVVELDVPAVTDAFAVDAWADVPLAAALDVGLAADVVPALSLLLPPPPPPHAASITLIASVAADIATPRTREKRKPEERRDSKFVM